MGTAAFPSPSANRRLIDVLHDSQGGRNLTGVGLQADIADAAAVDQYDFVPAFDAANWRIVKPIT
jgi:hypothetical protein